MEPVRFESAVVAIAGDAEVVIALMDGRDTPPRECVALLRCRADAARALCAEVGSALKPLTP